MVYQIYDEDGGSRPRKVLFDIEIYMKQSDVEQTRGLWCVEMHSDSFISGVIDYIRDRMHTNLYTDEEWTMFRRDCRELEELRGWLWETHHNYPRSRDDAEKDLDEWRAYVKGKIYTFARKYGLNVNED